MSAASGVVAFWRRMDAMFVDREFFMRARGEVKFLRVSARLQRWVARITVTLLLAWLAATLFMVGNQYSLSLERMALVKRQQTVATAEERVAAYRDRIEEVASDIKRRQDVLESLSKSYFGGQPVKTEATSSRTEKMSGQTDEEFVDKISAAVPGAADLARLERRQLAFAIGLTEKAEDRAKSYAAKIRTYGLDPDRFASADSSARGGPFIPFFGKQTDVNEQQFLALADALEHMHALESALSSIPSGKPSIGPVTTSGFGYRRDPFTGQGAMHSGLDFRGAYGSPVLAAAPGTVSWAGWRGGYGRLVEVDHGNGIRTRYAHLSAVRVKVGDTVERGAKVGRMGSSGRSTGTHLHFEVRVRGRAVDPAKFLRKPDA